MFGSAQLSLLTCQFTNNTAAVAGGAVYYAGNHGNNFTVPCFINNCTFVGCSSANTGGAITATGYAHVHMQDSLISLSQAFNGAGLFLAQFAQMTVLGSNIT